MYREPSYENPRPTPRQAAVRTRPSAVGMVAVVIWFLLAGVALLVAAASVNAFAGLTNDLNLFDRGQDHS